MKAVIELQLIEGNIAVPSAVKRSRTYEREVSSWYELQKAEFIIPLLEDFYGEKVESFDVGDACEEGPFLGVYFANGQEEQQMINVRAYDAVSGSDLYSLSSDKDSDYESPFIDLDSGVIQP